MDITFIEYAEDDVDRDLCGGDQGTGCDLSEVWKACAVP